MPSKSKPPPGLSKESLEIALAAIEHDIESVVQAGPDWRAMLAEVTAAAELQEAIEALESEASNA
jgi:hypothetical protein